MIICRAELSGWCQCPSCVEARQIQNRERVQEARLALLGSQTDDTLSAFYLRLLQPLMIGIMATAFFGMCLVHASNSEASSYGDYVSYLWAFIIFFAGIYILTGTLLGFKMLFDHPVKCMLAALCGGGAFLTGYESVIALTIAFIPILFTLTDWDKISVLFGFHFASAAAFAVTIVLFANHFGAQERTYRPILIGLTKALLGSS